MRNKTSKTETGLEIAALNLIKHYQEENCRVATVTLRGRQTMYVVGRKLTVLLNTLKPHFQSIIAVCSLLEDSAHVHLLLVMKDGYLTVNKLKKVFKAAKSKAKFGIIFDFEPIRISPEHVAGYFAKNYRDFMKERLLNRRNYRGRAIRMFNVPMDLKIDTMTFESYNPNLANYRRALTRFAEIYGVEVGDEDNLENMMRLPMREIRQTAFLLVNTMAGKPDRWSESHIREAVSQKRQKYIGRLVEYQSKETSKYNTVGSADDFIIVPRPALLGHPLPVTHIQE
ncbi:MAG: hypothetical protein WCS31_07010 [Verrucomicrobiae bacterium]